jgi:segregation and condensation protein A
MTETPPAGESPTHAPSGSEGPVPPGPGGTPPAPPEAPGNVAPPSPAVRPEPSAAPAPGKAEGPARRRHKAAAPPTPGTPVDAPAPPAPSEPPPAAEAPADEDEADEASDPPAGTQDAPAPGAAAAPPGKRRRPRKPGPPPPPPPPPINPAAPRPEDQPQLPPGLAAESAVLDYKVNLENFYGPLDLLLHLIKEHEMSIEAISISQIAEQYCRFLEMMKTLDINLAGEFLVMAATLMALKARALVPREALEEEAAQEDPSLELIKKLIEYKRFKERARRLGTMAELRARRFPRGVPAGAVREAAVAEPEPLKDLELWPLVSMFARITRQIRLEVALSILYADIPIERFMELVLDRLRVAGEMRFEDLAGKNDRMKVVGTFLAILHLAKDQRVDISQDEATGDIRVALVDEDDDLPPEPVAMPAPAPSALEQPATGADVSTAPAVEPPPATEPVTKGEGGTTAAAPTGPDAAQGPAGNTAKDGPGVTLDPQ